MLYKYITLSRGRHLLNTHSGEKFHGDGSKFFDLEIFSNLKNLKKEISKLKKLGYTEK